MNPDPDMKLSDTSIISIYDLISIIKKFKFFIIIVTTACTTYSVYYSLQKLDIYKGNLEIIIDSYYLINNKIANIQEQSTKIDRSFDYKAFLSNVLFQKKYLEKIFPNILPESSYQKITYRIIDIIDKKNLISEKKVIIYYSSDNKDKTKEILFKIIDLLDTSLKNKINFYIFSIIDLQKNVDEIRLSELQDEIELLKSQIRREKIGEIRFLKDEYAVAKKLEILKIDDAFKYLPEETYLKGSVALAEEIELLENQLKDNNQLYITSNRKSLFTNRESAVQIYGKLLNELDLLTNEPPSSKMQKRYESSGLSSMENFIDRDSVNYYYTKTSRNLFVDVSLGLLIGLFLSVFLVLFYHGYNTYLNDRK